MATNDKAEAARLLFLKKCQDPKSWFTCSYCSRCIQGAEKFVQHKRTLHQTGHEEDDPPETEEAPLIPKPEPRYRPGPKSKKPFLLIKKDGRAPKKPISGLPLNHSVLALAPVLTPAPALSPNPTNDLLNLLASDTVQENTETSKNFYSNLNTLNSVKVGQETKGLCSRIDQRALREPGNRECSSGDRRNFPEEDDVLARIEEELRSVFGETGSPGNCENKPQTPTKQISRRASSKRSKVDRLLNELFEENTNCVLPSSAPGSERLLSDCPATVDANDVCSIIPDVKFETPASEPYCSNVQETVQCEPLIPPSQTDSPAINNFVQPNPGYNPSDSVYENSKSETPKPITPIHLTVPKPKGASAPFTPLTTANNSNDFSVTPVGLREFFQVPPNPDGYDSDIEIVAIVPPYARGTESYQIITETAASNSTETIPVQKDSNPSPQVVSVLQAETREDSSKSEEEAHTNPNQDSSTPPENPPPELVDASQESSSGSVDSQQDLLINLPSACHPESPLRPPATLENLAELLSQIQSDVSADSISRELPEPNPDIRLQELPVHSYRNPSAPQESFLKKLQDDIANHVVNESSKNETKSSSLVFPPPNEITQALAPAPPRILSFRDIFTPSRPETPVSNTPLQYSATPSSAILQCEPGVSATSVRISRRPLADQLNGPSSLSSQPASTRTPPPTHSKSTNEAPLKSILPPSLQPEWQSWRNFQNSTQSSTSSDDQFSQIRLQQLSHLERNETNRYTEAEFSQRSLSHSASSLLRESNSRDGYFFETAEDSEPTRSPATPSGRDPISFKLQSSQDTFRSRTKDGNVGWPSQADSDTRSSTSRSPSSSSDRYRRHRKRSRSNSPDHYQSSRSYSEYYARHKKHRRSTSVASSCRNTSSSSRKSRYPSRSRRHPSQERVLTDNQRSKDPPKERFSDSHRRRSTSRSRSRSYSSSSDRSRSPSSRENYESRRHRSRTRSRSKSRPHHSNSRSKKYYSSSISHHYETFPSTNQSGSYKSGFRECFYCYSVFPSPQLLQTHLKKNHWGEHLRKKKQEFSNSSRSVPFSPTKCQWCRRNFEDSNKLHFHIRLNDCWTYKCENCTQKFTSLDRYEFHAQKYHPKIPWGKYRPELREVRAMEEVNDSVDDAGKSNNASGSSRRSATRDQLQRCEHSYSPESDLPSTTGGAYEAYKRDYLQESCHLPTETQQPQYVERILVYIKDGASLINVDTGRSEKLSQSCTKQNFKNNYKYYF